MDDGLWALRDVCWAMGDGWRMMMRMFTMMIMMLRTTTSTTMITMLKTMYDDAEDAAEYDKMKMVLDKDSGAGL